MSQENTPSTPEELSTQQKEALQIKINKLQKEKAIAEYQLENLAVEKLKNLEKLKELESADDVKKSLFLSVQNTYDNYHLAHIEMCEAYFKNTLKKYLKGDLSDYWFNEGIEKIKKIETSSGFFKLKAFVTPKSVDLNDKMSATIKSFIKGDLSDYWFNDALDKMKEIVDTNTHDYVGIEKNGVDLKKEKLQEITQLLEAHTEKTQKKYLSGDLSQYWYNEGMEKVKKCEAEIKSILSETELFKNYVLQEKLSYVSAKTAEILNTVIDDKNRLLDNSVPTQKDGKKSKNKKSAAEDLSDLFSESFETPSSKKNKKTASYAKPLSKFEKFKQLISDIVSAWRNFMNPEKQAIEPLENQQSVLKEDNDTSPAALYTRLKSQCESLKDVAYMENLSRVINDILVVYQTPQMMDCLSLENRYILNKAYPELVESLKDQCLKNEENVKLGAASDTVILESIELFSQKVKDLIEVKFEGDKVESKKTHSYLKMSK